MLPPRAAVREIGPKSACRRAFFAGSKSCLGATHLDELRFAARCRICVQTCDTRAEISKERHLQLNRIMSKRICYSILLLASLGLTLSVAQAQAPLPAAWPKQMELGMADAPGGAATMKSTAPFAFRYQYLAGGANTGSGWATWNTNGDFAKFYIQDSMANGIIPVFTYYMLLQSTPGGGSESDADFANLNNTATMTAYFNDLKLFFQKAGAFPAQKVVLHVEPDLWGYMEQRPTNDDARTVPAKVSETGTRRTGGPAEQRVGLRARRRQAPRRVRAQRDPRLSHQRVGHQHRHRAVEPVRCHGRRARRAGRRVLQLARRQLRCRVRRVQRPRLRLLPVRLRRQRPAWWDAEDFRRSVRFLGDFRPRGKRIVMWQIPLGNTKMRAQNNTTGHYQDNRPEWLLDEPARTHLAAYRDAGVVAFLFGGGAGGTTCACNGQNDGVTNPAADQRQRARIRVGGGRHRRRPVIRGTTPTLVTPYAADDDGGFFRWKAWQYYQDGAMPLPSGAPSSADEPENRSVAAAASALVGRNRRDL